MDIKIPIQNIVSMHSNKSVPTLVTEVKGHLYDAQTAETRYNKNRLAAGQKLLELRHRVESGEVGEVTWWKWYETQFTKSRRDAERVMKLASSDNPDKALETERKASREHIRTLRHTYVAQENQGLTRESVKNSTSMAALFDSADIQGAKPSPDGETYSIPIADLPKKLYDIVEHALSLVTSMTTKQRKLFDAEYKKINGS